MRPLLEGKRAIVTGAARGIGRATAEMLAAHGASVILNDLDGTALEAVVSAIRSSGIEAHAAVGDITQPDFPLQLAARASRSPVLS